MRLHATTAFVVVLLAATTAACSTSDETDKATPTEGVIIAPPQNSGGDAPSRPTLSPDEPLPDASRSTVDREDPDAVAKEAVRIIYTRNAAEEKSESESYKRALGLMTKKLADTYTADSGEVRPSQPWTDWVAESATIAAETEIHPQTAAPDTDEKAHRMVMASEYPTAADGSNLGTYTSPTFVTLSNGPEGWAVDELVINPRESE